MNLLKGLLRLEILASACMIYSQAKMQVIGTGLGRTGTDSLKEALNILGYNTYHVKEIMARSMTTHFETWKYLIDHDCKVPNSRELFEEMFDSHNYTAVIGISSFCANELIKLNPDAKFVHTERESAEQWQASVEATICSTSSGRVLKLARKFFAPSMRLHAFVKSVLEVRFIRQPIVDVSQQTCHHHKQDMLQAYTEHNKLVKKWVPRHKLLVIQNHSQGWGPLCKFLNKPIPQEPFPNANSREAFIKTVNGLANKLLYKLVLPFVLCLVGIMTFIIRRRAKNRAKKSD